MEYAVLQIQILHINLIKQNMLLLFLKVFQSQTKYIFSEFIYWWPIKNRLLFQLQVWCFSNKTQQPLLFQIKCWCFPNKWHEINYFRTWKKKKTLKWKRQFPKEMEPSKCDFKLYPRYGLDFKLSFWNECPLLAISNVK